MANERLFYLPLGGAGEIGMNAYVYGYGPKGRERLILVDAGVTFPDAAATPGVDLIVPDFSWLVQRSKRVEGIFISHAHEDHLGAIGIICSKIDAPVYARPFTASIASRKLEEFGVSPSALRVVSPDSAETKAGPFSVTFLKAAHSVPEASGLLLKTPGGAILHTGDFKFDESPVIGEPMTAETWKSSAGTGLKALVCDSTNSLQSRKGRSEASVGPEIQKLIDRATGMVVATTFASNVARIKQIAEAGRRADREVVLLGRALHRMLNAALESGVISGFPRTIDSYEAAKLSRKNVLVIATGSQGEPRAATMQLAVGKFHGIEVESGDILLYSSKTIPGNEKAVLRVINLMARKGVEVIDDSAEIYHVSGHPNEPDLEDLHRALNPECVIPMHGEHRHMLAHAKLANRSGINSLVAENGCLVEFRKRGPIIAEEVETGRAYLDGFELVEPGDSVVGDRRRIAQNGYVSVVLTGRGRKRIRFDAAVATVGLPAKDAEELELHLEEIALSEVGDKLPAPLNADEIKSAASRAVRREVSEIFGKKPVVAVKIVYRD